MGEGLKTTRLYLLYKIQRSIVVFILPTLCLRGKQAAHNKDLLLTPFKWTLPT